MNKLMKIKSVMWVFVLITISVGCVFAGDITMQGGWMFVDDGIRVGPGDLFEVNSENVQIATDLYIYDDLIVGSDENPVLWVDCDDQYYEYNSSVKVGTETNPFDLKVYGELVLQDPDYPLHIETWYGEGWIYSDSGAIVLGETLGLFDYDVAWFTTDMYVEGKVESEGGYDPPYVLYDQQSRQEVIDRVKKEVSPEKQSGAALFFNKENKKLETYVASEGKFYDLEGNVIHELAKVVEPTTKYKTVYHLDSTTGQVRSILRPIQEKYQIKKGYALDDETGSFINRDTKQVASREEALEIYAVHEGKVYDLEHNFVRNIEKKESSDIAVAGNNSDAQINTADNNIEKKEMAIMPASLN